MMSKETKILRHEFKPIHGACTRRNGRTKEYISWCAMKARCYNKNSANYKQYGGRGIRVCERWLNSFSNFLDDMGVAPSENHTLDRHPNPNGNYERKNCRWATPKEQNRNRTNNRIEEYCGRSLPVAEWCDLLKLEPSLVYDRLSKGWSFSKSVETPLRTDFKGAKSNRAIFSQQQREEIYSLFMAGKRKSEIVVQFNSSWSTIHSIIKSFQ